MSTSSCCYACLNACQALSLPCTRLVQTVLRCSHVTNCRCLLLHRYKGAKAIRDVVMVNMETGQEEAIAIEAPVRFPMMAMTQRVCAGSCCQLLVQRRL